MSIVKITVLAIFATLVLFENVKSERFENFTLSKFLGIWHLTGLMTSYIKLNSPIRCEWFEIERQNDSDIYEYKMNYRMMADRNRTINFFASGKVIDSEVYEWRPESVGGKRNYTAVTYNHGEDLILFNRPNMLSSLLVSRRRIASLEAEQEFERLALLGNGYFSRVDQHNCRKQ